MMAMVMMMFFKAAMMWWCKWNLAREMSVVPSTATPHTVPTSIAENTAILGEMKYSLVSGKTGCPASNDPVKHHPCPAPPCPVPVPQIFTFARPRRKKGCTVHLCSFL